MNGYIVIVVRKVRGVSCLARNSGIKGTSMDHHETSMDQFESSATPT